MLGLQRRRRVHRKRQTQQPPHTTALQYSLCFAVICITFAAQSCAQSSQLRIHLAQLPSRYCDDIYSKWPKRDLAENKVLKTANVYAFLDPAAHPLGEPLSAEGITPGWELRATDQFAAERWFQVQLQQSPLLVSAVEEADVVYVCGAVFNSFPWLDEQGNRAMRDFVHNLPQLLPHLYVKPHVIVLPHVARDYWSALKEQHVHLRNFTAAVLEPYTVWDNYMVGWSPAKDADLNGHFISIPYPTHLHMTSSAAPTHQPQNKTMLAMQSMSWRTYFPWRRRLMQDCQARPSMCQHQEWVSGEDEARSVLHSMELTQRSWYCIQPVGDTPLRRSFYDCIMWDAIPVVFHEQVFDVLPFRDVLNWSQLVQHIPSTVFDQPDNLLDVLASMHQQHSAENKLSMLQSVRHVLQYSMCPQHQVIRFEAMRYIEEADDAFTFVWKAVMRKLCREGRLAADRCKLGDPAASATEQAPGAPQAVAHSQRRITQGQEYVTGRTAAVRKARWEGNL